ncbi:MAG TPA: hypothetical protein DEB39_03430 [Planctomycetaceae bacterium]|nr:hypothetical protein [Planctomycetaceae bacterium]
MVESPLSAQDGVETTIDSADNPEEARLITIMDPLLVLAFIGLLLVFLTSAGARALSGFSRHRLEELCEKYRTPERLGAILKNHERAAVAATSLRIVAAQCVIVSLVFRVWPETSVTPILPMESAGPDSIVQGFRALSFWPRWGILVLTGSLLTIATAIWLPYPLVRYWGTPFLYFTWPLWRGAATLLYPFELVVRFIETVFCRLAGIHGNARWEDTFEDEIRTIVTEGHREGLLEEDAREMIEGVIELSDVNVSEIMTPRTDMTCISKTLTWEEMLARVITIPHSRIPVYDTTRDDIVGVLIAKDLLAELAKDNPGERIHWTELMNDPIFVPETKPVSVLLQEFQKTPRAHIEQGGGEPPLPKTHSHLAVVLDEYGGVSGLVTLEDILEEIVGDIVDEHDPILERESIRRLDENTFDVLGRVHIDELNEQLGFGLPENDDFDTIAGLVFSSLGHIPTSGETLVYGQEKPLRFTVLEATKRRIDLVRIERNIPST